MALPNDCNNAGKIFGKCFDSASPATDDKNDNALVLMGGEVS